MNTAVNTFVLGVVVRTMAYVGAALLLRELLVAVSWNSDKF